MHSPELDMPPMECLCFMFYSLIIDPKQLRVLIEVKRVGKRVPQGGPAIAAARIPSAAAGPETSCGMGGVHFWCDFLNVF